MIENLSDFVFNNKPNHSVFNSPHSGRETIAITRSACSRRVDQAELAWVAWLNTKSVYPPHSYLSLQC